MLGGGVDKHIHPAQFGFRPRRGTADALTLTRRMVDAAHQDRDDGLVLLLLDWAKAFDRVKRQSMMSALKRFGIPGVMVQVIDSIYTDRRFLIQDHAGQSGAHPQATGIAQGCPLWPYLFIIVQSVL